MGERKNGPQGALDYVTSTPRLATMDRIWSEVVSARRKFRSSAGSMTALTEEVGELAKALLDESWDRVEAEAVQVAAMAIRVLEEGDPTLDELRAARAGAGEE